MPRPEFAIGDRVSRPVDVYRKGSPLKFGRVRDVRFGYWSAYGYEPVIYDVQWDGEAEVSRGYLPHGIEPVPESAAPPAARSEE